MAQHVQYRPIGAGQIVGQAVEGYRRLFRHLLVPTCLLVLPAVAAAAAIVTAVYLWLEHRRLLTFTQQPSVSLKIANSAVGKIEVASIGALLLLLLSMILMSAVTAVVVSQGYIGLPLSWRSALRVAFRRLGSLLLAFVLVAVVQSLLSLPSLGIALLAGQSSGRGLASLLDIVNLATFVAEVYLDVAFVILAAVIVLEGARGPAALRRAMALVRGRWWATFGTMLLLLLLQFVAMSALLVVSGVVLGATSSAAASLTAVGVGALLLFPLQGVVATLIYFDLRNRHGGIDLDSLAQKIGLQAPMAGGAPRGEDTPGPAPARPVGGIWPAQAPAAATAQSGAPAWPEPRQDPGPDPGAASQRGKAPGEARPMWPAVSPKPPPRRPVPQPEPPDGRSGGGGPPIR
ncbi:MAG: hypothetical protein M0Z69_10220 [Actinomycetota bacterium]|nr:hypothetical protein [Actinomycetota bacterium]